MDMYGYCSPNLNARFIDDLKFEYLLPGWTLANILHDIGMFPSVRQARKSGLDQEIPGGWHDFKVGKRIIRTYKSEWFERVYRRYKKFPPPERMKNWYFR